MDIDICDILGIKYPIIQGAMAWVATAELSSAVSNAGGLGILSPITTKGLVKEIKIMKGLTKKPFGVNIPIMNPNSDEIVKIVIEEGIPIVTTSVGDPNWFTSILKKEGIKVIHVVTNIKHAKRAEDAGVDAVVAMGVEAGGHIGKEEITTSVLVQNIVNNVKIPVIAAGGIVNSNNFLSVLALGADGVQCGTRFIATEECIAHDNYKRAIINAESDSTEVIARGIFPARVIKNGFYEWFEALTREEKVDKSLFDINFARSAILDGDIKNGAIWAGQNVGMIKKVIKVKDVIKEMMNREN
ncbi:NAD(P)H-dependent flavin oxidoreductase [Candidatus Methanoliparum sp. LAM-1]|uniref:NAD(P)H-dependent flavin oxidoreductase n=1 Tax=Candidatus Methanoliparum sp. LAM-1 TaxID=2874846 RepID=UPI001E57058C|nr:nitronate monooxygenase [Candidatus Methanoliparum sp. LAM-1]BDC35941.1 2-nitropropane dioxygenase [Candidatus Methanoliparum sp. LAM-1]